MEQKPKHPMNEKDIAKSSDNKIDQDFPGFPNAESSEKLINPKTEEEKKVAAVDVKDGEKVDDREKRKEKDESESDGSGGAFDSTETMQDDDYDNSRRGK